MSQAGAGGKKEKLKMEEKGPIYITAQRKRTRQVEVVLFLLLLSFLVHLESAGETKRKISSMVLIQVEPVNGK